MAASDGQQQQALEAQFDDLMGGFGTVSNGEIMQTTSTTEVYSSEEISSQGEREGSPSLSDGAYAGDDDHHAVRYDGPVYQPAQHEMVYHHQVEMREKEEEEPEPEQEPVYHHKVEMRKKEKKKEPQEEVVPAAAAAAASTGAYRFEDTIDDFQPPKRYVKEEKRSTSTTLSNTFIMNEVTPSDNGGSNDLCTACQKRVYEMEKVIADNKIYHKTCFKCTQCRRVLSLGTFAGIEGQLYCKPHFISTFKSKGNYEEGFGKKRHSSLWQQQPPPVAQPSPQQQRQQRIAESSYSVEEQEESRDDIVRGDDSSEPVPHNLPSIRSLKSRFESSDSPVQNGSSHTMEAAGHYEHYEQMEDDVEDRDPDIVRESHEKEEVHFTELNSVRSRFESSTSPVSPQIHKTVSKWDRPKEAPPPPVNSYAEPVEQYDSDEPRPVRKMTPPRDELERDIQRFVEPEIERDPSIVRADDPADREDELPPPAYTRSILSKFQQLEASAPSVLVPSPTRAVTPHTPDYTSRHVQEFVAEPEQVQHTEHHSNGYFDEAEGGVYENDPVTPVDLVRESDGAPDEELPECGLTKSLLAQWQSKLQEAPSSPVPTPQRSRSVERRSESGVMSPAPQLISASEDRQSSEEVRQVVRESDSNEEEFLPPPSYTHNMLAKFRTLEAQAQQDVPRPKHKPLQKQPSAGRQFKWQVREARPLNRPHCSDPDNTYPHDREQPDGNDDEPIMHHDSRFTDNGIDADQSRGDDDVSYDTFHDGSEGDVTREGDTNFEDEMPEQGTTRNLLAKFQAMQANTY